MQLSQKVKLIVITGGRQLPENLLLLAKDKGVNVIVTPHDTYITSKLIKSTKIFIF